VTIQRLPPGGLMSQEKFLLDWLSKEDFSSLGECEGQSLTVLINCGLAQVGRDALGRRGLSAPVSLTEAGWALLRQLNLRSDSPS
jgi:hypothetical protein